MKRTNKHPDATVVRALALHRGGLGYRRIAGTLDVPRDTVRSWVTQRRRSVGAETWVPQ